MGRNTLQGGKRMQLLSPPLTGPEATLQFLSTLKPKDGSKELWVKIGHTTFYKTDLSFSVGQLTYKEDPDDEKSRVVKSEYPDFLNYLHELAKKKDGGVFYIPSQPQGLPLTECVSSSDDVVFEMDNNTFEDQLDRVTRFCEISGLELASLFTSGGKSIHGHFKLDSHTDIQKVVYINCLIAIALRSDPIFDRPHQPSRIPGFFRKEKDNYQEILFLSHTTYTYEEIIEGFKKFFDSDLLEFPDEIPEEWWSGCIRPILKLDIDDEKKTLKLRKNLIHGIEGWRLWKESTEIIRKQKQDLYESRKNGVKNLNGESLVDLVRKTCEDLEEKPFDFDMHGWQWSRGDTHARGTCQWHESKTNSAFIDARGGWSFQCPTCTGLKPLDALAYWQMNIRQETAKEGEEGSDWYRQVRELSGLGWVKEAKQWLEFQGVEVPDLDLGTLIETAHKFPEAPELQINEERSAEPGGWEDELEKSARVMILQDRTSTKIRYGKKIREHFGISQGELNQVAIDVNVFNRQEPELVGNLVKETFNEIQQTSLGNTAKILPSALYGLNQYLLKGYARGTKVVLSALSSTGKTAIALKEAFHIAKVSGEAVAFFSAESPTPQMIYRLLSQITGIPLGRLFRGQLNQDEWGLLLDAMDEIATCKLYIDGTPGISTSQIRQKLMRLSDEVGSPRAVFVDHLSKLAKPYPGNVNASMEAISHDLSNIVNELNTVGFWLCQFNRGHTTRQTKEPELDDVRDTDAIVQDGDVIIMPHRPGARDEKFDPEMMHLYVRKNRDGPLGKVTLRFIGECVDIRDGANHSFDNEAVDEEMATREETNERVDF
jgi:replicative DNA helicase